MDCTSPSYYLCMFLVTRRLPIEVGLVARSLISAAYSSKRPRVTSECIGEERMIRDYWEGTYAR